MRFDLDNVKERIASMNEHFDQNPVEKIVLNIDKDIVVKFDVMAMEIGCSMVELMELVIFEMNEDDLKKICEEFLEQKT